MQAEQQVFDVLNELKISYTIHTHPPVYTVDEAEKHLADIPGAHCKNLFLKDKKLEKYYLVIALDSKKINLKELSDQIGANRLSFASEDELLKYLGLTPGAVSAFGIINDANDEVAVVIDGEIKLWDKVNFHPNVNTATLTIGNEDFERFLRWSENEVRFVELDRSGDGSEILKL